MNASRRSAESLQVVDVLPAFSPAPIAMDRLTTLMLVATVLVTICWQVIVVTWPISPDAGVFLWIADLVANGGAAYRDAAEAKFPFSWLPVRWMIAITGSSAWAIRIIDLLSHLLCSASLYVAGKRLGGSRTGAFAVLVFAVMQWGLWFGTLGQPEAWVGSLWAGAFALLASGSRFRFIATGVIAALGVCVKPYFLATALVAIPFVWSAGNWRIALVSLALAFAATVAVVALYLHASNSLIALFDIVQWARQVYVERDLTLLNTAAELVRHLSSPPFSMLFPFAVAAPFLLYDRKQKPEAIALGLWISSMVLVVAVQGKLWDYHWLPLFPAVSLGCALVVGSFLGSHRQTPLHSYVIGLVVLAGTSLPGARNAIAFVRGHGGHMNAYQKQLFDAYDDQPNGIDQIVHDLKSQGLAGGSVLMIYGYHLGAYPLGGIRAPGRFANLRYVYDGKGTEIRAQYRREFMADLERTRPLFWIYPSARISNWRLEDFPAACQFVQSNYELVANRGDFDVYRWRGTPGSTAARSLACPDDEGGVTATSAASSLQERR